jgi:hypothetical protein
MQELVCNLHMHTTISDGSGTYDSIAKAAYETGVDVIIVTDHNILVKGVEKYYYDKTDNPVLLLTSEEVHDQSREPQKNHALVLGADREVAQYAYDPQLLIDKVNRSNGLSFLAHPYEYALPLFHEDDISWVSWEVNGYTGIELWNNFSEFKTVVRKPLDALFYGFFPEYMAHAPLDSALQKWDSLLTSGRKINAVGGADAHAIHFKKGILKKVIFPYHYHFSAINNHLLVPAQLSQNLKLDKEMIYTALRQGSFFIGYDLPAPTTSFTFMIENTDEKTVMGGNVDITNGGSLRVSLPRRASIRLIHNGQILREIDNSDRLICTVTEPGYYRIECHIDFLGKRRGWIYSNPIYTTIKKKRVV